MRACPTGAMNDDRSVLDVCSVDSRTRQRALPRWKLLLFVVLSLADLSLTWWLLTLPDSPVHESNPVAGWCLAQFGWLGLAGFKAAVVVLVAGLAVVISRRRPRAGGLVLGLGCAALVAVLLHSALLCRPALDSSRLWGEIRHKGRALDAELPRARAYRDLLGRAGEDLVAGRRTLQEVVDLLAASERGQDPTWLKTLASHYRRTSPRECLAINALLSAVAVLEEAPPSEASQRARQVLRLGQEFRQTFGSPLPDRLRGLLRELGFGADGADYVVASAPPRT
jgi:hypothetical protein